ncbi:hypothetical protein N9850_14050 [Granulosicoccus sp.]|nr:hypothetical protein [Granulosicoccus sp.]MDB4224884.1 hypothetical protein [Granulosicoccus sp.]
MNDSTLAPLAKKTASRALKAPHSLPAILVTLSVLLIACSNSKSGEPLVTNSIGSVTMQRLISISDLNYEGAFTVPSETFGDSNMNYSAGPLEVNGNSMFIVGHNHDQSIAEFKIPLLVDSLNVSDLNSTGKPVQNFNKFIDRATDNDENLNKIVGMELVDDSLVVNLIDYYDAAADNVRTTILINDADSLSTSALSAIHLMEGRSRAGGWISRVPEDWQSVLRATHISGNSSGYPIIGRFSVGPSAFAVNLSDSLQSSTAQKIETKELQGFSLNRPLHNDLLNKSLSNGLWTHMSHARYGFIVPGTSTYLTIGVSAGHETGVGYKNMLENGVECLGFCPNSSTDIANFYWLWDMNDWLRVRAGKLNPSEITPYDHGELKMPFQRDTYANQRVYINPIGGASYDEESGLLYISILHANVDDYQNPPVVVAYSIGR